MINNEEKKSEEFNKKTEEIIPEWRVTHHNEKLANQSTDIQINFKTKNIWIDGHHYPLDVMGCYIKEVGEKNGRYILFGEENFMYADANIYFGKSDYEATLRFFDDFVKIPLQEFYLISTEVSYFIGWNILVSFNLSDKTMDTGTTISTSNYFFNDEFISTKETKFSKGISNLLKKFRKSYSYLHIDDETADESISHRKNNQFLQFQGEI